MTNPEFWGGRVGDTIGFSIVWLTVMLCANTVKKNGFWRMKYVYSGVLFVFVLGGYTYLCHNWPSKEIGRQQGREEATGLPINSKVDGHVFTPLAFVITEHRILVYDKDEKVYALDGIKLEDGLKPETLTVGTNVSYVVYTKAGQLYFGRLDHPKPEKS